MVGSGGGQVGDATAPTGPPVPDDVRVGDASDADDPASSSRVDPGERLVATVRARLRRAGIDPGQEATWLVQAATDELAGCDRDRLDEMVARRVAGEPLQVVLGSTGFRHVTVACRSGVFVPRPETEVVAGVAIDAVAAWPSGDRRVLDLCTGTGAIALAVASEVPDARVVAGDRDRAAVDLARDNVARLAGRAGASPWRPGDHLAPRAEVTVHRGDLVTGVPASWQGRVAVLVANPPYLPVADRGSWAVEVAEHDPDQALVGGPDGHELVDAILALAPSWLAPGGTVVVELDQRRADDAVVAAGAAGLVGATLVDDLAGRPRAVVARRAGVAPTGHPTNRPAPPGSPAPDEVPSTRQEQA